MTIRQHGKNPVESEVRSHDGLRLYAVVHEAETARAQVVITHGMGEHSGRYPHVRAHLAAAGITAISFDLRGHGKSEGTRGYLRRYQDFLADLDSIRERLTQPSLPLFFYGHSLGGQITANYLIACRPAVSGVILASPWLELAFRPPLWRLALAAVASKIHPRLTQNAPVMEHNLSRDAAWLESLKFPGLAHRRMSAGMFAALVRGARQARLSAPKLFDPLLVMHGESDPVTCKKASSAFVQAASSTDKRLHLWPEMLHETHNEIGRETVLSYATGWILQRTA